MGDLDFWSFCKDILCPTHLISIAIAFISLWSSPEWLWRRQWRADFSCFAPAACAHIDKVTINPHTSSLSIFYTRTLLHISFSLLPSAKRRLSLPGRITEIIYFQDRDISTQVVGRILNNTHRAPAPPYIYNDFCKHYRCDSCRMWVMVICVLAEGFAFCGFSWRVSQHFIRWLMALLLCTPWARSH